MRNKNHETLWNILPTRTLKHVDQDFRARRLGISGTMVYMTRPHKQRQDARTLSCTKNTEQRPSCQPKLRGQRPSSIMHGGRHVSRDRTMQIQRWSSRSTSWASASLKRSGWCGVHHKPTQCKFGKVHHCDLLTTTLQNWNKEQWLAPIKKTQPENWFQSPSVSEGLSQIPITIWTSRNTQCKSRIQDECLLSCTIGKHLLMSTQTHRNKRPSNVTVTSVYHKTTQCNKTVILFWTPCQQDGNIVVLSTWREHTMQTQDERALSCHV